jgi:RNase P subunit RPR2
MASKGQNNPQFARLSHLYQAAALLGIPNDTKSTKDIDTQGLSRFYLHNFRSVARKQVLRVDSPIKRTICKRCESLLVPGVTSEHRIENKSKDGKKKWADVLVVECKACGTVKRFPVGQDEHRAKRKLLKKPKEEPVAETGKKGKQEKKKAADKEIRVFKIEEKLLDKRLVNILDVRDSNISTTEAPTTTTQTVAETTPATETIDVQMDDVIMT